MVQLKQFRKKNNLTQDELGDYLGIKKSFISRIEHGMALLPEGKFNKLLENPFGWDITPLTEAVIANEVNVNGNVIGNHNEVNQCEVINKLVDELSAQRKQNDTLISIIDRLTAQK